MLRVLNVVNLKIFIWNPNELSDILNYLFNQFNAEKFAEQQIIKRISSLEYTGMYVLFTILIG